MVIPAQILLLTRFESGRESIFTRWQGVLLRGVRTTAKQTATCPSLQELPP